MDIATPLGPSEVEHQLGLISKLILKFARRYFSRHDAEDLAQDVVLEIILLIEAGRWHAPIALEAWCARAVQFRASNARRDRRYRQGRGAAYEEALVNEPHDWMQPDLSLSDHERRDKYYRSVGALTPACRRVWMMVREGGASYDEAAEQLGVSRSAIAWHLVTARRKIKNQYQADARGEVADGSHEGRLTPTVITDRSPVPYDVSGSSGEGISR